MSKDEAFRAYVMSDNSVTDANGYTAATLNELDAAKAELEAFKREVSDAVIEEFGESYSMVPSSFHRFILPKPDPLVEAIESLRSEPFHRDAPSQAEQLRRAAELLGYRLKLERIEHE